MASSVRWDEARDHLKKMRDDQLRCSEEVVAIWNNVLHHFTYKLGDELWLIYEQVLIAALDCGDHNLAKSCYNKLKEQFPDSSRVARLQGLILEAMGKYEKATELYDELLETDKTNAFVQKRKSAMLKAQGKVTEAIKELTKYLETYMTDYDAWLELCDMYIGQQDYSKAAFCMEELIMSNPHNHLYHQKYAEIKYTQGNQENMECAQKYFSQAVKLNPDNMRALFGLFMAASNLASQKNKKKESVHYAAWAAQQICERYRGSREKLSKEQQGQLTIVEKMLDTLQISGS